MLVMNISKRRNNGGKRRRNWKQKRSWFVYFYDEDGVFHSKRVSTLKAYWLKLTVRKVKLKYDK